MGVRPSVLIDCLLVVVLVVRFPVQPGGVEDAYTSHVPDVTSLGLSYSSPSQNISPFRLTVEVVGRLSASQGGRGVRISLPFSGGLGLPAVLLGSLVPRAGEPATFP